MFPPKDIAYIVLAREPEGETTKVILPNQDSYDLEPEQLDTYLKLLKIPEDMGVASYVWNFGGAKVDLASMEMETLSVEQALSFGKQSEVVNF